MLGSLPHRSPSQALAASRRYAGTLLAWPQLPQRSFREEGLAQAASGFPGLLVDQIRERVYVDRAAATQELDRLGLAYLTRTLPHAALTEEDASGLFELLRQRDSMRGVLAVKGHLFGPISLAAHLTDEHQRPLIYDEMFFEALVHHLHLRAAWQSATLASVGLPTIVCIDEPFLDAVGLPFLPLTWESARSHLNLVLDGITGCKALYGGGAVNWGQALTTSAELVIADVFRYGSSLVAAGPALAEFLERDGIVGLGIVPTEEDTLAAATPDSLASRIKALALSLEPLGIAPDRFLRRSLICTSDMLGWLNVEQAERALQLLAETSRKLREEYRIE
jgi:hypothetical protein